MVLKSEYYNIRSEFEQEIGEEIIKTGYNDSKNCVEIVTEVDPEQLVREVEHLGDEYSIEVVKDRFRVY
jgi:hypothetical protein